MPELPEVETVVRGLRDVLPGRRVVELRLGKTDFIDDAAAMGERVPGSLIRAVRRHGKFLVLDLEAGAADGSEARGELLLVIHLGMTGQLLVVPADAKIKPHTHAFFTLDDGRELRFRDTRRFGRMLVADRAAGEKVLGPLGADPLEVSKADFLVRIWSRHARIKALLMDQHVFRGMGNIYTDESLWRARIHPARLGANLREKEIWRLYGAMRDVLEEAIELGGSSISDYVRANGLPGEFQIRHRVYDRKGEKCFRCGTKIRRIIVAGRSSYFCPKCQGAPRGWRVAARRNLKKGPRKKVAAKKRS
jgi:formamidopyrimidine-DNA glycosylase